MIGKEEFKQVILGYDPGKSFRIDLQLFAKPEDEGRTEDPTIYKERKAREEGKVARSQEMVSGFVLLAAFIAIWLLGDYFIGTSKELITSTINNMDMPFTPGNLGHYLENAVWNLFKISGPILLITVVVAFLANVVQVGFMFSPKAMKVDFKKVSFTANKMFSKIFFSKQTAMNLVKSVFKIGVVVLVTYIIVNWKKEIILNTINMEVYTSFSTLANISFYIG
ncbi:MAG TPA: hypothetical protein ENI73_08850, partial [Spirochaetes bacterium]|nr:hypothetical protein [Spirochaetota bacterium]